MRNVIIIFVLFCLCFMAGCATRSPNVELTPSATVELVIKGYSSDRQSMAHKEVKPVFREEFSRSLAEKGMVLVESGGECVVVVTDRFAVDTSNKPMLPLVTSSNPLFLPVDILVSVGTRYGPDAYDAMAGVNGESRFTAVVEKGGISQVIMEDERDHYKEPDQDDLDEVLEDAGDLARKLADKVAARVPKKTR